MSTPLQPDDLGSDDNVMDLAVPYALHALTDEQRDDVETRVNLEGIGTLFYDEVRAIREVMATVSAATAVEPPEALRERVLTSAVTDNVRTLPQRRNWRQVFLAVAAVAVIGLGAVGVGLSLRPAQVPSTAEQIFAASDVRTISGELPAGGLATVVFSRERDAAYLVMNNVPPPSAGTVYQMWLLHDGQATPAGVMDSAAVRPSTTAVVPDIGDSTALAFTIEPPGGSSQPTSEPFASLPLV